MPFCVKQKIKDTCKERYGTSTFLVTELCKQKCIDLWGVDNYRKTEKCKQEVSYFHKTHKDELNLKRKKTFLERYDVDNAAKIHGVYDNVNWAEQKKKERETKTKNGTLGGPHSKAEDIVYNLLNEKFPSTIRHYFSEQYPFECDFYIPELNLYIEYNGLWTHGNHFFNKNSNEDLIRLQKMIDKNTAYYNNAIQTWTVRDVNKLNIAIKNKLNYLVFWSIKEVEDWLKNEDYKVYIK